MLYEKGSYRSKLFLEIIQVLCNVMNFVLCYNFCVNLQVLCNLEKFCVILQVLCNLIASSDIYTVYFL